jgi:hypothetical protein
MKIEILWVQGCPNAAPALRRLRDVLAAEGLRAEIQEMVVSDAATASRLQFPGSPTLRVNGRDVEEGYRADSGTGLACRLYDGSEGLPSWEAIRRALLAAVLEQAGEEER